MNSQVARLNRALLMSADEAFFATCDGSIAPINSIDARLLGGAESIGTLTRQFHDRYWQKRWSGWHATPVDYMSRARPRCQ
ncbi:hypothetical protein D9M68_639130 [compost metagenome]